MRLSSADRSAARIGTWFVCLLLAHAFSVTLAGLGVFVDTMVL
jgi:hypothetical protein